MPQTLWESAAVTTSSQGSAIVLGDAINGAVGVAITAISSTAGSPSFTAWVQGSFDGGTTWFDLTSVSRVTTAAAATELTGALAKRNVVDTYTSTDAVSNLAYYNWLPPEIRIKWLLTGSGPTCTFAAWFHGR